MAQDQVEVMQQLGFERFMVAGHDRGARAGYRMALDHPERVLKLSCIDILPTHHVWTHVSREWALNAYHWAFMAQPYDFPERLLAGKEEYYIRLKLGSQGSARVGSARRRWTSTSAAARPTTSTPCARTTAPARRSTTRWTPRTSRLGAGSRARCW
jgi:pimeloyl-ACP methyl ester carboxylesterase